MYMCKMRTPLFYPLLLLLLGLSCLLAVPASRSLGYQYHKLKQEAPALNIMDQRRRPAVVLEEALVRGRMDMQSFNDYPGSGANNRHDPKTPGRP